MRDKRKWIALGVAGLIGVTVYAVWPRGYCRSAKLAYGIIVDQCPDGDLRQSLRIDGWDLRRSGQGTVTISATALYTVDTADQVNRASIPELTAELTLVDADGKSTPIEPEKGWSTSYGQTSATIMLPAVNDGDYALHAKVHTKVGDSEIDLPLPLYAPARIHVLTDRPLYEPGNVVEFRTLVVRARDLTPIEGRPGMFVVTDPSGEVLLEEKAPAGEWGVVAGSFPLDRQAATGTWTVTWKSGDDRGQAQFRVEPFTLPRFRVELTADRAFYSAGDVPRLSGMVAYSSGAPVAGAAIEFDWRVVGEWPPPTEWLVNALPRQARSGANGRFAATLPEIPADLVGRVTLIARVAATDPAGDRVTGQATVLLSHDAIQVQAITELADGLVENANNRVYLRVTSADGRPLPGAIITVKPTWLPGDENAIRAELDADSVASIQIDPGPPVNVIIPPMPARRSPGASPGQLVNRVAADDLVSEREVPLVDLAAMDSWLAPLEKCAKWVDEDDKGVTAVLRAEPSGVISTVATGTTSPFDACVASVLRSRRLPAGSARLYSLGFTYQEPPLPELSIQRVEPVPPPAELAELVEQAASEARDCLPRDVEGELPWSLSWQVTAGQKRIQVSWLRRPGSRPMAANVAQCILAPVARIDLSEPAEMTSLGLLVYTISQPDSEDDDNEPQPTIMKGYELSISAEVARTSGNAALDRLGQTTLRMQPGSVPALRLRADPVLASPGDSVVVTLLRGPSFSGDLPTEIYLEHFGDTKPVKIDKKSRTMTFQIPGDGKGWYEIEASGYDARALVYVQPKGDLSLTVTPAEPRYPPGSQAILRIATRVDGVGARAAVGLFGVDDSLSQLVALPGVDELGGLRPQVTMTGPAFGVIDGTALALGRIRGRNAAEATILRVASIPEPPELDVVLRPSAETVFDPVAELTSQFYNALAELHQQARNWEKTAPASEQMTPETMARLWNQTLDVLAKRGESVNDAFGRRLRLHRLPDDLLELTDPRNVIVVGTRLPEDVENWNAWVRRKRP